MTQVADKVLTTEEVVARFKALASQEKWFEIQDELFAENVRSIEPQGSLYMQDATGKAAVRRKAEDFVSRIEAVHRVYTSDPVVTGNHIAVARETDITVRPHGRIQMNEIMLYEVKDGQIILEQFFY